MLPNQDTGSQEGRTHAIAVDLTMMPMERIWPIDQAANVDTLPFVTRPALFGWATLLLCLLWLLVTRLVLEW